MLFSELSGHQRRYPQKGAMRTSIATVCLSGTLDEKLVAAREAGFDGVEIFEPDLVASPDSPEAIRARADELGLSLDLYQPFRDFEGVGPDLLEQNLRRAAAKFALMNRLGIETMLLCSNVATARSGDEQLAAAQLRELGDLAEQFGVRIAYEALAWGRFVDSYEAAARVVRLADHARIGLCLDSFHILSKGHNPEAIETIAADKIFFVQLADAPLLSMDVLSWSRHHRLFPGEGGFDLGAFMGHLVRTGYDGPDLAGDLQRHVPPVGHTRDRRQRAALAAVAGARDGILARCVSGRSRRSHVGRDAAGRRAARRRQLRGVADRGDGRHAGAAGTARLPFARPHRTKSVELWSQGDARIVLGRPESDRPQPTVAGIGLSVRDPDAALRRAVDLFAPEVHRDEGAGDEPLVGVRAPDGSELFFGAAGGAEPAWVREFGAPSGDGSDHIARVDHINLAQPWQHFDAGVLFFHAVLDLHTQPSMEVAAPVGLVRSQVLRSADGIVRIALNLVPPAADKDAILPQHLAFAASDVLALARAARDRGFRPLDIPANYYDDIEARFDIDPALLDELKDLNVMYDRDESGEFLHFYTPPVGTVFLEVVERRGGYDGYGALNAPVRLAAQYQQRHEAKAGASA